MKTPRIEEMVEEYAESYKHILPPELIESSKNYWRTELQKAHQAGIDDAVEERKNLLRVIAWLIKENVGEQVDVEIPDYAILKDELDIPFSISQRRSDKNNGWVVSIKRKCYVDKQSSIMVCWCGNCKQADYDLPVDYKKTIKALQDNK